MRKIYCTQRCLLLCSQEESAALSCGYTVLPEGTAPETAVAALLDPDRSDSIVFVCDDVAGYYGELLRGFKQVNAAGGLVRNTAGGMLVMFRNGVWDLPKGHQEPGEAIECTAEREIAEETGVTGLRRGNLICITDHCYFREGIWHLKHTWWYEFTCPVIQNTTPQVEEGISEVRWIREEDVPSISENTYPSIREVFGKSK